MPVCAKHNVETLLRCGKCDKPICPDCLLIGPAGMRCKECAAIRSSPLYQVNIDRLSLGLAAGLLAGTIGGFLIAAAYQFGFVLFWIGLVSGTATGETILRVVDRKRGPKVEAAAVISATLGAVAGLIIWFVAHGFTPDPAAVWGFIQRRPFYLLGVGAAIFGAVSRARFF